MRRPLLIAASTLAVLLVFVVGLPKALAATETLFGQTTPPVISDPDTGSVTLGTRVTANRAGTITTVRFYKGPANLGTHIGAIYSATGTLLRRTTFTGETTSGWQTATFGSPLKVSAGSRFSVAVFMPRGRYAAQDVYPWPHSSASLSATSGVYTYGSELAFPTQVYESSNYFIDVGFTPAPNPAPSSATPSSSPTSSVSPPPSPGFSLTPVDGGTGYYRKWSSNTFPTSPSFFPIGVWSEQSYNASKMKGFGINTYVTTYGSPAEVTAAGLYNLDPLDDEADMRFGPGWDVYHPGVPWPNSCTNATGNQVTGNAQCGYTDMQQAQSSVAAGEMRYANYGKGVGFWEDDSQAAKFVNDFQDVVSIDLYWGTDTDLCAASQGGALLGTGTTLSTANCHKPSNYGRTVDRVRSLVSPHGSTPVFNFVELGHPGTGGLTMPVAEIKAAVWSSLIHEARGIIYFNHSFGGSCQTQHVLTDCNPAIGQTVTAIDAQIKSLAPVLNSPKVNGVTKTGSIDQLTKWDGKNLYVFTGSTKATGSTTGTITIPGVGNGTADVLGENRTVRVVNGTISDAWADPNTVHLYKIR